MTVAVRAQRLREPRTVRRASTGAARSMCNGPRRARRRAPHGAILVIAHAAP
ncbi:hypothetical protein K788_00029725 [Paraburkholderia caribensis MBA4]|uniref:Uncharacterized protein n=1 Tax=Paraburkholderia caribensis MBA4 TaxID=1323664 RepID=A0A0P0R437_9BURK|nr:hypothetical protein K788_00029725 [Paraburkholderia caribensis MBA4]